MTAVDLEFLLKGGWFALFQAGRLVNDADVLLEVGSYSTAAGVALLSREEVAKSRLLFRFWTRTLVGQEIARGDVLKELKRLSSAHAEKQRLGASTFTLDLDQRTRDLLTTRPEVITPEYEDAQRRLSEQAIDWILTAHDERHERRKRAFYVDPAHDSDAWLRPTEVFSQVDAAAIVRDARNDYQQQRSAPGMPELVTSLAALNAALDAWTNKPELPPAFFA